MADVAYCAYCFECLSASFQKRKPLSLATVAHLWQKYEASKGDGRETPPESTDQDLSDAVNQDTAAPFRPAAISRLLLPSRSTSSSSVPSASSSTPSLATNCSSRTSQSSKSASKTSLFSLPGRLTRATRETQRKEEYPLFVTWDSRSRTGHKSLRGCIGTFDLQELEYGLQSYALTSAFEDTRFMPITEREVSALDCSVTLLTNFESISDPMDWDIGTHGLRINFTHNGRRYGATYLPDVAREQGWTKNETMISLMRKAGWTGRRDDWRNVSSLNVIRYQGSRCSLSFQRWRDWRRWIEDTGQDEEAL